jgi:hypothetical protein
LKMKNKESAKEETDPNAMSVSILVVPRVI